ncbi:Ig-like domain-containing protein [uncultured Polaribacter sp.]|uniref:DUF7507 domain-containing protein n=2 Tax=uncultured Polaribacter sp. TaxID=174711 RepID=UPI00261A8B5E|nr:Ig-like domain-containing protein [uncultured Polaribacter sp.]
MKKRLFIFSVALLSIIQFNYGYNVINTNEIANAISKKDAKNSFSENFYSSYEANWENLENFNTEFNQSAFASKQFTAISASALKATNYTNASASFSQLESIPVGSYVIAMDDALQPDGNSFNLKAYGLIVRLLHADIPLKWAINSAKVKDGLDFSVAASRIKPTTQTSQSRAFRGGPIIIAPGYESQALTVINAFNNGVYVYETTAAVDDVEIYSDLTHKPKAAVFNDGGKSKIHTDIYKDAGLSSVTHYNAVANSATIINAASCYTFASEPHSDHNDTDKKNNVELFLKSGGNFLAQCHGVESYTRLGLLANFVDKNDEGAETYSNFSEPFAQFIGLLPDEGGSVKDFELLNEPLSGKSIIARPNNHHVAYVGKITGVTTTNGGYVHYLGGHEHDHINGQRLLLNALLTPADRPTDCNLNICLNVLDQGTMSTPRDTYLCTSYPIVNLIIPPITPTAATGGSGGAIEYQWQKRHGGGSSWTNITGATNANYNPPNSPYNGTTQPYGYVLGETYYRRGAKTTCASSYKYTEYKYYWITRNVENPGSIGGDEVSCGQYDPSNIWNITYANGGGGSSIQYQWQESTDGIAWNNIVGANAATYNPANISVTMQYRRGAIRTWEGCSTSYMYSNTITKTVDNTILNLECEYKIDGGSWIANDCSVLITQGQKLELSTNPNNLASYSWSGPNSFSGTGGNGGDILVSDSMTAAMTGTYTVVATNSNGCSATTQITVTAQNAPPVAVNDTASTNEDTPVDISILTNDSDPDGTLNVTSVDLDPATLGQQTSFTVPAEGTYTVNNLGVVTFTPILNFNGTTTPINYTVNDNDGLTSNIATITVTVNDVNDPPVAVNDTASTNEDTPVDISILTNDSDPDGTLNVTSVDLDPATLGQQTSFTVPAEGTYTVNNLGVVTFTPILNFNGTTTPINYTVNDNDGLTSNIATITVTVNDVNDPPVAVNDTASTNEDTPVDISILTNDSDPDGTLNVTSVDLDPATLGQQTSFTVPAEGTYTVNNLGVVTFTPILNFNGTTTPINYTVNDNDGLTSNIATITVTVNDVNDPPVAVNDTASTNEDTPVDISILTNDSDPDGTLNVTSVDLDPATLGQQTSFTVPAEGTYTVNNLGVVTFTPILNFNGTTTPINYTVNDNDGLTSNIATITVTVNDVNDPPVAVNDTASTNEDTPVDISILTNDSDPDGTLNVTSVDLDPATLGQQTSFTVPAEGTYTVNNLGVVTFTPILNFNGTTTPINYTVNDNDGLTSNIATITVTVNDVNDPPVAVNDTASTNEDTPVDISILTNDSDPDGTLNVTSVDLDPATLGQQTSFTVPAEGTYTVNNLGVVTFTPILNFNGTTTPINYTVNDNDGLTSNIATITVTVNDVNDPPVAVNDTASTNEDTPVDISILTNDSDPDGTLNVTSVDLDPATLGQQTSFTVPAEGTYTVNNLGVVTFTPILNFNGTTTPINYTVNDNDGLTSNIATITVTVNDVNDPPVAVNDTASTNEDTPVDISILTNDSDPDGTLNVTSVDLDPATLGQQTSFTVPAEGTYTVNNLGVVTFTPILNFNGTTTPINYTVNDNDGLTSNIATITVTVNDVNDPPVAVNDTASTNEDTPVDISILTNDSDPDGTLNVTSVDLDPATLGQQTSFTVPAEGTYTVNNLGVVTFTPILNFNGTTTPINYTVNDNDGLTSNIATITVTVNDVNDPPVAVNDTASTNEDTPVDISILTNDSDPDGTLNVTSVDLDPATLGQQTSFTVPAEGTYTVNNLGVVTFTPILNFNGTTTPINYTVNDNDGLTSNIATITVTVNDVNDPPVAVNDTASTNEDTPVDISILTNDSDPDGTLNVTSVDLDPATPGQQTSFTVVGEGTYTVDNAGVVTFDPAENFNGVTTPIDYTVDDNDGLTSNVATVTITVTAQNDPPVATDDTYIMDQDTSIILTPLTEGVADSDPDNDTLVIASINGKPVILGTPKTILVPNGSVNYSATGVVTFTPTPGYVGTSSFPYTISDGNGGTDDATENITVLLAPAPALTLEKTANTATYNVVGDIITYSYKVTNSGNVILDGPFTIADNKITVSNITVSLAPGAFETVTATYAVTQADLDNGNIINIASATDTVTGTTSPEDTVTVTAVQNPALTLEKSANVTSYSTVDEVITYSYKVTNSGNVTLDGPFTIADNKITVSDITVALAPGEFETVTATYTIVQADLDNGNIINIASATDTVTGTTSLTDTVTVDANQNPALTLKKTSDEATYAAVGEVITYRYKVTNSGNVTLDGPFTIADNKITVSDITVALAPGEFETVTATHTITQADLDNGNIINIASATDTVTGTTSLTDTVTVDANQNPALTFEKTANVTTYNSVGEVIIYSYKIINSGNVTLDGPFSISDDKITVADAIGSIAPGESLTVTQTYRITQADIDAGFITNIASASNGTATSPTDTVTITADVNPALTLDKTANVTTYDTVGDQIIYSYKVTNSGDVVISGPISITDDKITVSATIGTLSPGASITVTQAYIVTQADLDAGFITNVASASNGVTTSPTDTVTVTAVESPALTLEKTANVSTYTAIGDQIIYSYKVINSGNVALAGPFTITDDKITVADGQGPLSPGASVTVTETYTITQADLDAGLITNVASVTDGTTTSPTDTVTVNIYIAPAPALTLEKTANTATYSVGDVIIYNYRVINSGNVTLDGPFAINDDKISIAPAVGILTPGESVTVTQTYITTQADYDAGSITNIASTTDGTTTSPEVSLTINAVDAPALTLEKTANVNTYTAVGDQIIYTYKVINSGNVALAGPFVITDDKITVQDAPGPLFPGESSTVTETYTVTQADLDAGSITNIAFASYGATTSPTDAVTVNVFVVPAPALTLEKTANATTYSTVGEVIIYSYKIINSGNVTLDGPFSITDDKIAVADAIGSIAPGESLTVTQTYIITQADIDAGSITNVASTSNGTTTSPTDTVTITADVNPALTLDKTANVTTYDTVGDQIIYSYKVTNSGDVLISGPISITDDKITVSATIGTLSPGVSITVTQTYIITQADLDAGSITNVASATNGVTTSPTDTVTVTATTPTGLGSIGDTVWYDTDGDGIVDAGEPGLMGVTVTLDPGTPGNPTDDVPAITDVNGNYLFENLPVGVYTVTVDISTLTGGLPAGKTLADIIPISDGDGVGTPNTITLTLPSGQNNLDQDFAYGVSSGNTGTGNNGGVESESLGDAISKIYVGRKKNSMPTEFVKSSENLYNKVKLKSIQPYQGKGQTLLDMFPTELVAGNVANVTSPTDILDYTIADEVLSVDFSINGETKGVVLGIKTSDKIYNHTKASCDRLRGAEILNVQKVRLEGYNFLMQGIKQRNGVVEYAISFAVSKNNNDDKYTIQTNWYVNNYIKFNDAYNFQVWSTKPADTQKLVQDILDNLKSYIPVQQTEIQKFPETYASKIYREKGELVVNLRSTEVGNTAEVSMVELYSETANNIKHRYNSLDTEIQQSLRLDIADGYEYDGLVTVEDEVEDAFYHADGNWGLDYDSDYTEILNYFVWNDFDRTYQDDEYSINRNVEIKATSEYDYLTVYKSLLPGTLSADYSEYKYLSFTAKGSGLMELGLIKSSVERLETTIQSDGRFI